MIPATSEPGPGRPSSSSTGAASGRSATRVTVAASGTCSTAEEAIGPAGGWPPIATRPSPIDPVAAGTEGRPPASSTGVIGTLASTRDERGSRSVASLEVRALERWSLMRIVTTSTRRNPTMSASLSSLVTCCASLRPPPDRQASKTNLFRRPAPSLARDTSPENTSPSPPGERPQCRTRRNPRRAVVEPESTLHETSQNRQTPQSTNTLSIDPRPITDRSIGHYQLTTAASTSATHESFEPHALTRAAAAHTEAWPTETLDSRPAQPRQESRSR